MGAKNFILEDTTAVVVPCGFARTGLISGHILCGHAFESQV